MKQPSTPEEKEKKRLEVVLNNFWKNPLGKASVIAVASLGLLLAVGGLFKAGAFTMNAYKDFRDANKR